MQNTSHGLVRSLSGSSSKAQSKSRPAATYRKRLLAFAVAAALPAMAAPAADIFKADNLDDLDLTTSWVDGVVPTTADVAVWNQVSAPNLASGLNAPISVGGLRILNPAGTVTIGAVGTTNALTLGSFGIDMSSATHDLVINAPVTIQGPGGYYDWNVAAGRTLTLAALPSAAGRVTDHTGMVRFGTTGTIKLGAGSTTALTNNQGNPYALYGNNDWAATDAVGNVVAASYTAAVTALTAGANNDIQGDFTQPATVDFTSLRFNDPVARTINIANSGTSRTWTARGILVTENSGGATIGGQANTSFIRPARSSVANTAFNIVQNSANDLTISARIANGSSGAPTNVVKHGPGRLVLTSTLNDYTGGTTIHGGSVVVSSNANLGAVASAGPINLGGGTLLTTATMGLDNGTNFRAVNVASTGGALNVAGGTSLTVGGVIGGTGTLHKDGAGALVVTGAANTHTGLLSVNTGNLQMSPGSNLAGGLALASSTSATGAGSIAGAVTINGGLLDGAFTTGPVILNAGGRTLGNLNTGAVTVNAGATFSGQVTSSGTVTVNSGGTVSPGNSVGTMNLAGLDLSAGTQTLNFEFGVAGAQDRINVTGADAFTLSGSAGSKTVNILSDGSGTVTNGVYTVIDYAGTALADVSQLTLGTLPLRMQATGGLIHNTADTSIQVDLSSDAPKWAGNVNSNWDINTTQNWKEITSGNVTTYLQPTAPGDNVLFDSTATNGAVNLTTTLAPASVTIDNDNDQGAPVLAYTFTGTGKLTGSTGVTKLGVGTATLANTGENDYTGPTTVTAGTLVLGADHVIGDASDVSINGGATLSIGAQSDVTGDLTLVDGTVAGTSGVLSAASYNVQKGSISAILGGTGGLTKTTADVVIISAPATYAGGTTIENGTLQIGAANALPAGSVVTLGSASTGGTLDLSGNSVKVAGLATTGAGGTVNSAAAATLTLSGAGISSFAGSISGAITLAKGGTGTQFLAGSNSYGGGTVISGGVLNVSVDAALGSGNLSFTGTGGTLQTSATVGTFNSNRSISVAAGATGTIDSNGAANNLELTGLISGDGILGKAGAGNLRLATVNTYTGGTAMSGGNLIIGNGNALGTGAITFTGGSIQLESGITLGNSMTVVSAAVDNMVDVPGGGDATFAGNVTNSGGGQFRPAATGGGTLYLTGATNLNNFFIIPRGNIVVAGSGSVNTSNNAIVGRINQFISAVGLTVQDNATFAAAALGMGGGATGGGTTDLGDYAVTVRNNAQMTIAGTFDLLSAVPATSGTSRLNLDGGVTSVGSFIKTTTTVGSNINFNGGTLRPTASSPTFLPALTGLTAEVRDGGAVIDTNGFDITIEAPLVSAGSGVGGLTKAGAGTLTLPTVNTYGGPTTATGGKLVLGPSMTNSSAVAVSGDGIVELSSDGSASKVIKTGNVTAVDSGRIDLKDNKLITSRPVGTWNGTSYTEVAGLIDSGRGSAGNALWDGPGITTTDARAIGTGNRATLGVIKAGQKFGIADAATATFAGQVVTGADTLVMLTWGGDATMDGKVNIDDYGRIDSNVAQSGSVFGWYNGDFNYDGVINIDDYGIIDGSVGGQGAAFPTAGEALAAAAVDGVSAVPEPGSFTVIALAAAAGLGSRRRRSAR